MPRLSSYLGSSVSRSVSHGRVTDELPDLLRGGGEVGGSLAEIAAVLGGIFILLLALVDFGRAALLRAQAAADEAEAQRAAAEALVQIARRDNQTVNLIARSQAVAPVLMWLAVLAASLAVLAVVALIIWNTRRRQVALEIGSRFTQINSVSRDLPEAGVGQELALREHPQYEAILRK